MVRRPAGSQRLVPGLVLGGLAAGLCYAGFMVAGAAAPTWVLAAAFVAGFLASVGAQNAAHAKAVRRFASAPMETALTLSQLRDPSAAARALALRRLERAHLADARICHAVLDLASDERIPEGALLGETQTVAELARERLRTIAPASGAWPRVVAERGHEPTLAAWLAGLTREDR